ncbi:sialic acid TRAP transporter substrate-binding protein SiaP [Granulosicoccus sp. 3-233]|uniref:sialic acid TRAP transporter substrate-binding protein SiaP n=1 Tax=Granulosicoccus sp. 3-233 TaxID=3417969 RepID=UPI003D351220
MKIRNLAKAVALAGVALAVAGPASAARTLQFAHVYEIATPYHQVILKAAEELEKRTEGRYEMKVFPASSLGKETAINEGLSLGTVDVIYTGVGFAANSYGPISISDYPFTMRGQKHWEAYRDSDLFSELADGFKDTTGNEIVALTYYGARHVTSNKPILTPADMENLKIRVPNAPSYLLFPEATGANPTPMAFSEVYLALQQGVVDAQENPLPTIQFKKFYEVQSNINLTGHITNSLISVVSGSTLASMDEADQQILKDVLKEAALDATQQIVQAENELADWFREQGNTVNEVDRGPFIEAVQPFLVSDDMPWPSDVYERLQAIQDAP